MILVAFLFAQLAIACGVDYQAPEHWTDERPIPPIGSGKVFITNSGDDTLTWIDLETLEVVFEEPVGRIAAEREGPHHGAVRPDGSSFFVGISNTVLAGGSGPHGTHGTGTDPGYLLEYDTATHELLAEVQVDRSPGDIRITPDGAWIVMTHSDLRRIEEVLSTGGTIDDMASMLAIIDTSTMRVVEKVPVCPAAHGVVPSADSQTAYVACWGSDELAVVSLSPPFDVVKFPVGPGAPDPTNPNYAPYAININPADGKVWLSCQETGELRIFDPAAQAFEEPVGPLPGGVPYFGDFLPDGSKYYVAVQGNDQIVIVDNQTREVDQSIALPDVACQLPHAVLMLPGAARALVVCEGDHFTRSTVAILNVAAGGVEGKLDVGVFPDDAVLVLP